MSRKLRIVISCILVVLAFGAGIFAYAHTYGGKTKEANAVTMPTDYFVDKFGKIVVPPGPVDGSVDTRGTEDNPFFILEIVPYDGMAKVGYLIDGQEPIDVHAMARDNGTVPGESQFYTATNGVRFDFWKDEKPETFPEHTTSKTNQYGIMTRVEDGMGDYKRVEGVDEDGNPTVTYAYDFNGNFEWSPLTLEECLALGDAGEAEYNEINNAADTVGAQVKIYFEDVEYVTGYGKTLEHNDVFLRESVGLAYEFDANGVRHAITDESVIDARVDAYKTIVYTVTPEDLNLNLDLIDRADIIFISTQAEMIPSSGDGFSGMYVEAQADGLKDPTTNKVREKYKYVPYVKKDKFGYEEPSGTYGRKYNLPGATYSTNQLSWEAVVKIYENNTSATSICPIVADFKMYNNTKADETESVTFRRLSADGTKLDKTISGTQNNLAKLFMLNYQMTNPVFEAFYGELSAADGMFESVAMANGLKNKDGSAITTGKFNYDKDWSSAQKTGLDQDSKTYWDASTLLPWRVVQDGSKLDSLSDYSAAMAPYLIMVDSGTPYDMTSHTNTIRNGFLCFDGDNKVGQTFDSQASGMTDDAYGYEVYDYFDSINGSAARPGTDDLTMADCINYLLGGSHGGPSLSDKVYRVLELEASPDYESVQWFWKPLIAAHTDSLADPVVETMTTSEFIGSRVDCMGAYDLIYVGVNKFTGNNDPMMNFSGTNTKFSHGISTDYIYAHTGPKVTVTTQTVGSGWWTQTEDFKGMYGWLGTTNANQEKYFVYSGNDLTLLAYDKLKEYGAEGFPILFGSGFYSNTGVSSVVSKIDRNSYVYKLGTSASNRFNYDGLTSFTESNKLKDILTINSKKVDFYFASESDYPLLYDDDTTKPDSQRYINGSNINNHELKFTFKVLGPAGTTYRLKLFVDANTDGMYRPGEEDLGVTVRKADNTIAAGGVVEAGGTYTVRKTINDRIGSICWKLALVENNADEEKVYASFSGVSAIKDNPSDTTDNKNILVLQIVPDTMSPSLLLPMNKEEFNPGEVLAGNHASEMFYDLINVEDTDGDGVKDGINGMKISFVRMTQDEVLVAILGDGTAAHPPQPNYLKETYDMLVLGFADRYDGVTDPDTLIPKINEFIAAGKAVLYTHDGASVIGETGGVYTPDSKTITETFRDKFGMDRYGALNNVAPENMVAGGAALDVPYIPESGSDTGKVYKTGTKSLVQGLTNGMLWRTYYPEASGDSDRNINTEKVARVNVGAITEYPYNIPETIDVATTHPQVYQLDMEEEDMVVWYTLTGGTDGLEYENQYYGASPKDIRNNYYIYNKANITYTGMGHKLDDGTVSLSVDEIKLFVNTFIAAYRATAKPVDVQVVNDDVTVNSDGEQFLCVDVDSSDAANVIGDLDTADISPSYTLQKYDSAADKFVVGDTISKQSKRVYFKLLNSSSYGTDVTSFDVKITLNDGTEMDGIKITGEIGDPDDMSDDSMLAVYEKSTGQLVDGNTVKFKSDGTGGLEHIYYVDVPLATEKQNNLLTTAAVTTTKVNIAVTMYYKYSNTADPIEIPGDDLVYIMPRGLFDLD